MPDITASAMDIIKAKFYTVFENKGNVQPKLKRTPITAPLLMQRQTAKLEPLMAGTNSSCVGTRIWYSLADNSDERLVSGTAIETDCEITGGDGISTESVEYDFNIFMKPIITLNDNDCGNLAKFTELMAELMIETQTSMAQGINTFFIQSLETNKSLATATDLPDGVTIVTGDYTMADPDYWQGDKVQEGLANVQYLAEKHGIHNFVVLAGKNFKNASVIASFNGGNVGNDKFGDSVAFGSSDLFWDYHNLDRIAMQDVLFVVDTRAYASYFYAEYPEVAEEVGDANGTIKMSVPFRYYNDFDKDNGSTSVLQFFNGAGLEDARIDVLYQKVCDKSTNKNKKLRIEHKMEYDVTGMFALAPNNGDETGILKIVKG